MLVLAMVVFIVLFFIVRSYKECSGGTTSGGGSSWDRAGYKYEGSIDSDTASVNPIKSRLAGVFRWTSPESWPFRVSNPAAAINASHRGRVSASPHVMTETPAFLEAPESYDLVR